MSMIIEDPVVMGPEEAKTYAANRSIAHFIGGELKRHYPLRVWAVQPQVDQGVVDIFLLDATGRWAYTLHLAHKTFEILGREAVRAGGEILERFNLSREKRFNRDHVETLSRNIRGEAIQL